MSTGFAYSLLRTLQRSDEKVFCGVKDSALFDSYLDKPRLCGTCFVWGVLSS